MGNVNNELKMTHSCILSRGKEKIVRVTFESETAYAEGIVPSGIIEKQNGFTEDEVKQLELYLKLNQDDIMKKAKEITGITHWF
ncbi:hypothetical protein C8E03_106113 [Lachnotalea glycerini]|uniref:Uncharacterized protein n=2 Tax=Lachnotalea glycerini TaxID=1763509 RepID=A0A318EL27_9FIRM|nr:hypothetical protein [Lachnotalea glycerini]PXV89462.1 hypothetical protein C8E03_106113 [Lachnotalea glycerini]